MEFPSPADLETAILQRKAFWEELKLAAPRWHCCVCGSPLRPHFTYHNALTCSIQCLVERRRSLRNISAGWLARHIVLLRDDYTCLYCGAVELPLVAEHIRPTSSGGRATFSNLVSACNGCNSAKGQRCLHPDDEALVTRYLGSKGRLVQWSGAYLVRLDRSRKTETAQGLEPLARGFLRLTLDPRRKQVHVDAESGERIQPAEPESIPASARAAARKALARIGRESRRRKQQADYVADQSVISRDEEQWLRRQGKGGELANQRLHTFYQLTSSAPLLKPESRVVVPESRKK